MNILSKFVILTFGMKNKNLTNIRQCGLMLLFDALPECSVEQYVETSLDTSLTDRVSWYSTYSAKPRSPCLSVSS